MTVQQRCPYDDRLLLMAFWFVTLSEDDAGNSYMMLSRRQGAMSLMSLDSSSQLGLDESCLPHYLISRCCIHRHWVK